MNKMTDTELVDDFVDMLRHFYQLRFDGHDTFIDRDNIQEHMMSTFKDIVAVEGRIDAIGAIVNGDY